MRYDLSNMATTLLAVMVLWSINTAEAGRMSFSGCTNAFIRLTCTSDDTLVVEEVQLTERSKSSSCTVPNTSAKGMPEVPKHLLHLCTTANKCLYEESVCTGKSDCVFYIRSNFLDQSGNTQTNSEVNIVYSCKAGPKRIGGLVGIGIVTLALVIAMIVTTFIICRRSEDAEPYIPFENRLSRTSSMTSEISTKEAKKKKEAEAGAAGGEVEAGTKRESTLSSSPV